MKKMMNNKLFCLFLFIIFFFPSTLFAQNAEYTDAPYWRQALGGSVIGKPVAQVESVVVATDGGNLKSFSSQGTALWDFYARGRLSPFVSRSREGTSYICRTNGLLIAVNRSGRELWRVNLGSVITYPVLTGWDGRLFIFTDRKITCATAAGYTLWSKTLENKTVLTPILDTQGGVILVQEDGRVHRYDPFGNVFLYPSPAMKAANAATTAVPAAAAALEIEGWGNSILLIYEDRHLELAYPSLGYGESLKGKLDLPSSPLAAAGSNASGIIAGGKKDKAAVLLKDGRALLVSLDEKKIIWTGVSHIRPEELREISERPQERIQLLYDERGVYILTRTGATGFTPDGRRLWYTRLSDAAAIAAFGDDGILYSGGVDWILYSYKIEDRVRAKQRLLYGEASEGSYGTGIPRPSSNAGYFYRFSETELKTRFTEIRQAIKNGSIGALEKEYTAWLMETAACALTNSEIKPAETQYRVEATRLLAFMGSRETIPFLADLFWRENDYLVKAAAAEAIGKIGVDPDGVAMRAFENAIYPPSHISDENALTTLAAAIGALCRFSGPPLSEAGVRLLTLLSGSGNPSSTQKRAQRELRSLGR